MTKRIAFLGSLSTSRGLRTVIFLQQALRCWWLVRGMYREMPELAGGRNRFHGSQALRVNSTSIFQMRVFETEKKTGKLCQNHRISLHPADFTTWNNRCTGISWVARWCCGNRRSDPPPPRFGPTRPQTRPDRCFFPYPPHPLRRHCPDLRLLLLHWSPSRGCGSWFAFAKRASTTLLLLAAAVRGKQK